MQGQRTKHTGSFAEVPGKRFFYTRRYPDKKSQVDSIGFWKELADDVTAFSYEFGDSEIHPQQECWWYS